MFIDNIINLQQALNVCTLIGKKKGGNNYKYIKLDPRMGRSLFHSPVKIKNNKIKINKKEKNNLSVL